MARYLLSLLLLSLLKVTGTNVRNFFLSSFVIQKISDELCLEHGLSVIKQKPYNEREKKPYPKRK